MNHPIGLFRPFRAAGLNPYLTQGGIPRLHRFAVPWADMFLALRADLCVTTRPRVGGAFRVGVLLLSGTHYRAMD